MTHLLATHPSQTQNRKTRKGKKEGVLPFKSFLTLEAEKQQLDDTESPARVIREDDSGHYRQPTPPHPTPASGLIEDVREGPRMSAGRSYPSLRNIISFARGHVQSTGSSVNLLFAPLPLPVPRTIRHGSSEAVSVGSRGGTDTNHRFGESPTGPAPPNDSASATG
ncbi:hypothetical protein CDAR_417421 [Caerostris darwini]|uniref:Uncharacterized protein n=1 Tax=Caerostris darwini TaxID=1538125 RepID=A0AAV4X527_9ARAC|nr:hypothetical protein CDAR_417421 [Caerostris darwini]